MSYISNGRGVSEAMVQVEYNPAKFNMKETEETRKMIEMLWVERTRDNDRIFNASKFRLAGHKWDEECQMMKMVVGITDYKDHVGTNLSPDVHKYIGEGDNKVCNTLDFKKIG